MKDALKNLAYDLYCRAQSEKTKAEKHSESGNPARAEEAASTSQAYSYACRKLEVIIGEMT